MQYLFFLSPRRERSSSIFVPLGKTVAIYSKNCGSIWERPPIGAQAFRNQTDFSTMPWGAAFRQAYSKCTLQLGIRLINLQNLITRENEKNPFLVLLHVQTHVCISNLTSGWGTVARSVSLASFDVSRTTHSNDSQDFISAFHLNISKTASSQSPRMLSHSIFHTDS